MPSPVNVVVPVTENNVVGTSSEQNFENPFGNISGVTVSLDPPLSIVPPLSEPILRKGGGLNSRRPAKVKRFFFFNLISPANLVVGLLWYRLSRGTTPPRSVKKIFRCFFLRTFDTRFSFYSALSSPQEGGGREGRGGGGARREAPCDGGEQ